MVEGCVLNVQLTWPRLTLRRGGLRLERVPLAKRPRCLRRSLPGVATPASHSVHEGDGGTIKDAGSRFEQALVQQRAEEGGRQPVLASKVSRDPGLGVRY